MKITDAKVIVTCPGRNFVTLKIETDAGVHGLGDATLNGRELAVASYLDRPRDPLPDRSRRRSSIEDIWQYLYRGAYWRRGPVTMAAIAAVDMALWDIKAKRPGLPLYQLLGGASRDGVMVYGHANGDDHRGNDRGSAQAYQATGLQGDPRCRSGVPGLRRTYGVSRDKLFYEPADAGLPTENVWSTAKYLAIRAQAVRGGARGAGLGRASAA